MPSGLRAHVGVAEQGRRAGWRANGREALGVRVPPPASMALRPPAKTEPPALQPDWSLVAPLALALALLVVAWLVGGYFEYGCVLASVALACWRIDRAFGGPPVGGLRDHRQ